MMNEKVGPLRTAQGLDTALSFCDKWLTDLSPYEIRELHQIEVVNMLEVARLIAQTALMRSESRGGHFRLDFPKPEERWRRHILLKH
jgi:L-aspartate oxidase